SGSKTIHNSTPFTLNVTIIGRNGSEPSKDGNYVSASIAPNASYTLQYGNDQNPYMNVLRFSISGQGMMDDTLLQKVQPLLST
ncbi:hypothetical protein, partial [Microcystis aeruginosa]|uniref:hypothetical protein n=1 Tax=Microcystis aeruginosa TaxID=1126 RepID=UPI0005C6571F